MHLTIVFNYEVLFKLKLNHLRKLIFTLKTKNGLTITAKDKDSPEGGLYFPILWVIILDQVLRDTLYLVLKS